MTRPDLTYFSPAEFGVWWPLMNRQLLLKLDAFRQTWGAPVQISGAEGAIGRKDDSHSQHNVSRWGEVRAIDIMPHGMDTPADRERAVRVARSVGFTGIGLYPHWKPRPGLHLDVRRPDYDGHVATWAGVRDHHGRQQYVSLEGGLA